MNARSATGWLARTAAWFVILGIGAVVTVAVLVPRIGGGTPYVVLTGSMRPHMPPGTLVVSSTAQLPIPLRRFRHPNEQVVAPDSDPQIAYPQDGVQVDLGIKDGDPTPLVIKVRNGAPPFTFYANGVPIGREPFDRAEQWQPDGPGFVTLSVVDSAGKSDRVTVFVE